MAATAVAASGVDAAVAQQSTARVLGWRATAPVVSYDANGRKTGTVLPTKIKDPVLRNWDKDFDLIEVTPQVWVDSATLVVEFCERSAGASEVPVNRASDNVPRMGRGSGGDCPK